MNILVINAGSSSLKYQLMDPHTGDVAAKGICERIGLDGRLTHKVPSKALKVKKELPDIILTAVVPFRLQYERWSEREKLRYHSIISRTDNVVVLSEHYYNGCLLRRNDYMLSHCNGVIAYYDGTPKGGT